MAYIRVSHPRPHADRRLPMPTRFLVGAADRLTTPEAVAHAFETIGSQYCELYVLGQESGVPHDYRHTDLLLADDLHRDVSPLVVDWLSRGNAQGAARGLELDEQRA